MDVRIRKEKKRKEKKRKEKKERDRDRQIDRQREREKGCIFFGGGGDQEIVSSPTRLDAKALSRVDFPLPFLPIRP